MNRHDVAYIEHLLDRDEYLERKRELAGVERDERECAYMEFVLDRDHQDYIKGCAYDLTDYRDLVEAMRGITRAVDQVYADRFDLEQVVMDMDGPETAFQRFLRLHHGLTPVLGGVEDFDDDELVIMKEDDGDQCYQMPYRRLKKVLK